MKILSIETSCDETAISIVDVAGVFPDMVFDVRANVVLSQAKLHAKHGGVFPSLAKREHGKNLIPVLKQALSDAKMLETNTTSQDYRGKTSVKMSVEEVLEREGELLKQFKEFIPTVERPAIDAIAVTNGPGLEPALWVGINFAKALGEVWKIPVIPVNHMEGHILGAILSKTTYRGKTSVSLEKSQNEFNLSLSHFELPAIALLISGGHTQLVLMSEDENSGISRKNLWNYKIIGQTRDDAVGEAFDKVARMLELPYPGGPEISKLAESVSKTRGGDQTFGLPRPMLNSDDFDFSFSGLKTAVLYIIKKIPSLTKEIKAKIAFEFEEATTEVLLKKTIKAVDEYGSKTIIIGGGVSANKKIREAFKNEAKTQGLELFIPENSLSTDNALMIAVAGYFNIQKNKSVLESNTKKIRADGNLSL